MTQAPEFLQKIDWALLRKQKSTLYKLAIRLSAESVEEMHNIEGIISLIDTIQDYVCDELGVPDEQVFGDLGEEDHNFLEEVRVSLRQLLQNTRWAKVLKVNDRTEQLIKIHNVFVTNAENIFSPEEVAQILFQYDQNLNS